MNCGFWIKLNTKKIWRKVTINIVISSNAFSTFGAKGIRHDLEVCFSRAEPRRGAPLKHGAPKIRSQIKTCSKLTYQEEIIFFEDGRDRRVLPDPLNRKSEQLYFLFFIENCPLYWGTRKIFYHIIQYLKTDNRCYELNILLIPSLFNYPSFMVLCYFESIKPPDHQKELLKIIKKVLIVK
jgi:hypothetical protein